MIALSLSVVAFAAGFVDAIAGGGGLLTLPALLAAGLPPHVALGTNKGQAVWGSGSALLGYARLGLIDRRTAPGRCAAGFLGALGGAALVSQIRPDVLRPIVLALLVAAGVALAARPDPRRDAAARPPRAGLVVAIAAAIGAYDGFFGPGTGTFLIVAQVWLVGTGLVRATADAKVVNFASNLAALAVFASYGAVDWSIAAPMAVAQFLGGAAGARAAVTGGERLVRWTVLAVVGGLVLKLGWDLLQE